MFANGADGVAIICMPTGIMCSVQAGGHSCRQPETEGFPLTIFEGGEGERVDDCKWGCFGGERISEKLCDEIFLKEYIEAINKFLSENINGVIGNFAEYEFDPERKYEVMEGWWPVLAIFKSRIVGVEDKKFKGYIHMGNCD
jgi:hypothetical protein